MPNSWSAAEAMNNELTRPCGHPLPSDPGYAGGFAEASGRGAGGEGSFSVEVHGPNARAHDVQVKAFHEPDLRELTTLGLLTPHGTEPGHG